MTIERGEASSKALRNILQGPVYGHLIDEQVPDETDQSETEW
jgi:hypothetical protein